MAKEADRGVNKGLYVLLSRIQAEPGRTVKQEQEEISRNHVQTFICLSVVPDLTRTQMPCEGLVEPRPAGGTPRISTRD